MDENLRTNATSEFSFSQEEGLLVLPRHVVVEVKFCAALPMVFKRLVEEFALNAQPFSKYRAAIAALGLAPTGDWVKSAPHEPSPVYA